MGPLRIARIARDTVFFCVNKRWNIHSDPAFYRQSDVRPGHFFAINRTADLSETVGRFYEVFEPSPSAPSEGGLSKEPHQPGFFKPPKRSPSSSSSSSSSSADHRDEPSDPSPGKQLFFSLPYQDLEGKGLVMSISQPFYDEVSWPSHWLRCAGLSGQL